MDTVGSRLVPFTGAYLWRGESRPQRRSRRSRPPLLLVLSLLLPPPLSLGTRKDLYIEATYPLAQASMTIAPLARTLNTLCRAPEAPSRTNVSLRNAAEPAYGLYFQSFKLS